MSETTRNAVSKQDAIHVYLAVFEFGDDANIITDLLGIQPTEAWVKGAAIGGKARAISERWVLESPSAPNAPIERQITDLLPILENRRTALQRVQERYRTALRVAAYYRTHNPSWELDADVVRRLSALNLLIDFDIYCLPNDEA